MLLCTWSPAPMSSSTRFTCTPFAISSDCCSRATKRLSERQSKPKVLNVDSWSKRRTVSKISFQWIFVDNHNIQRNSLDTDVWSAPPSFHIVSNIKTRSVDGCFSKLTFRWVVVSYMVHCVTYNFLIVYNGFARNFTAQQDHSGFGNGFWNNKSTWTSNKLLK